MAERLGNPQPPVSWDLSHTSPNNFVVGCTIFPSVPSDLMCLDARNSQGRILLFLREFNLTALVPALS